MKTKTQVIAITIDAFCEARDESDTLETNIVDLIADLLLYAKNQGQDAAAILRMATEHFEEETESSTANPDATDTIQAWLTDRDENRQHDAPLSIFYEHGQHYAACNLCGQQWSIVDCEPGEYDLEELSAGDESYVGEV